MICVKKKLRTICRIGWRIDNNSHADGSDDGDDGDDGGGDGGDDDDGDDNGGDDGDDGDVDAAIREDPIN